MTILDPSKAKLTMKKRTLQIRASRDEVVPPTKHIIKIPKMNNVAKPPTSRHIAERRDNPSQVSTNSGLVILIPGRASSKRNRELDSEEEREDSTLVAAEGPSSKRPRKVVESDESDDDNTLISIPVPVPKTRTLRKPKAPIQPNTTRSQVASTGLTTPSCSYTGLFDLYAMDHQDLCEIYRPQNSKMPQYQDLYSALRSNDNTNKLTARIHLPTVPFGRKFGRAHVPAFCNPISLRPYDIELTRISHVKQVFYRDHEKDCFVTRYSSDVSRAGKNPGVSGKIGVAPSGTAGPVGASCAIGAENNGVIDSSGDFNLSRVWEKIDEEGRLMEIFEGYMSLRVRYSKEYESKGNGEGFDIGFAFWAVRSHDTG
ncbi:hypothetical protein J3R30DRAFT_559272 [Lentinula aciculospora]|uniref:Uncharacterized protein n=1 Tax=Lentinula aciculospora TaxID=153920 RepID=A0A9W9A6E6_9AGAR|nr:hypothetical protein J3R30DRAFT_559272 [Lentinula aciculospora]